MLASGDGDLVAEVTVLFRNYHDNEYHDNEYTSLPLPNSYPTQLRKAKLSLWMLCVFLQCLHFDRGLLDP